MREETGPATFPRAALLAAALLGCGSAAATGLQVSPIGLTLQPTQNAEGLWLSNTGDAELNVQVRVYRWTQEGGEERLTPSRGLLVSPPMVKLPAQGRQLVRAIRAGAPPGGGVQEAYRVIVDELPVRSQGTKGLQFVLRYSIPVFVQPAGAPPGPPRLQWALHPQGGKYALEVTNTGASHAQLADLAHVDAAGARTTVHAGLLGYVLPGARMRWALKSLPANFPAGGSWEAMINGKTAQQEIPTVDRAP